MAKSKAQSPTRKQTRAAGRTAALAEQAAWINELIKRGWSYSAIDRQIDVRADSISRWHHKQSVARGVGRDRLAALYRSRKRPPAPEDMRGLIGPITYEERIVRDAKAKRFGLHEPAKRAARIRKLARQCNLTLPQLAQLLNIGYKTIHKYANPKHEGALAPPVLDALIELIQTHGHGASLSPESEFHQLARRLYGKFYETGFAPGSAERVKVLDILQMFTGLSRRALYPYVPPPGGFRKIKLRPSKIFIKRLGDLADMLEPRKDLLTTRRVLTVRNTKAPASRAAKKIARQIA